VAKVAVIGGGVAGLACAWKLARAGHEVIVLEREPVAGGRMRSERVETPRGVFVVDRGAQFVASGYRNMMGLVEALGLAPKLHGVGRTSNAILRDGRLHPGDWGEPIAFARSRLLPVRAKLRLPRLLLEIARRRRVLDPYEPTRAAAIDRESLADGLARLVGVEAMESLLAPAFSATFDADPEDHSLAFALLAVRFVLGGFRLLAFEGGIGLLTQTLAAQLPVRTGCAVHRVETDARGARIALTSGGRDETLEADAAVVAVPGNLVAGLVPTLTVDERGFFERVRYVRGMVCFVMTERAPATLPWYGVAFPRREDVGLYGLAVDHWKPGVAPAGAGLVNAALTAAAAERLRDAPDDAVVAHAVDALAKTPVGRLDPVASAVHRWDPMLPLFPAGHLSALAAFEARAARSPRLAFAGDWRLGPYTEMALTSGLRAATQLTHCLDAPFPP
jgi:oxygen-dependent protoporphyrinogen oxidase